MADERVKQLQGVHNFRDYGGYALAGGGHLKSGILWRSGQHAGASDTDLRFIESLNLADVFDLRSDRERSDHPCRRPAGFAAQVHSVSDTQAGQAPHLSAAAPRQRDAASSRQGMRRSYAVMPYRPQLVAAVRHYLVSLAEGRGASLINCMAGKDRTGFAVAMCHHALGVHRDDILADYLLTNSAGDQLARLAAGQGAIAHLVGELDPESLKVIMGVEAEYLEIAFARMIEDHGSIDAYQQVILGVDDALREALRAALMA